MRDIEELEIGLMFWAGQGDAAATLAAVRQLGLACGQLGIGGSIPLETPAPAREWNRALERDPQFAIATVFASFLGEDYSDVASVLDTVGFLPTAVRADRVARFRQVADFAAAIAVPAVACHIGFIPEDSEHPDYRALCDLVRQLCVHCEKHNLIFALETGQEPAKVLLRFLGDVDKPNLKINFDPANMILYGTGTPVEALDTLGKLVVSVHCKDGDWPALDRPKELGAERPLGKGSVDFPAFISKLKEVGYRGILSIEREEPDERRRAEDIRHGIQFLRGLLSTQAAAV